MYARTGRGRNTTGLPVTDRSGRTIGRIVGREYQKIVVREDQMLRSPPGFGFDAWAMEQLVLPRVDWVTVQCRFNGRHYRISAADFRRYHLAIDRGAGLQYVLPLTYWQETSGAAPAPATPAATVAPAGRPAPAPPVQGRLF